MKPELSRTTADAILEEAKDLFLERGKWWKFVNFINSLVSEDKCKWTQWDDWDNSDTWNTGCGQDYCGWEGVPPEEHGVNFCQHCGKPVEWQLAPAPPKEGK